MGDSPDCLSMIAGARARGLDVTTEAYPYTAGMTFINSALFNPGWRERRGLDYRDLELPESGERLTRERFEALHAAPEPRLILIHTNPDAVVDAIIAARSPLSRAMASRITRVGQARIHECWPGMSMTRKPSP
jgi:hypothetical protein